MARVHPSPRTQPTRRSRRERKKQETRQRLLESAWQLFQQKGYEHTTVEDITEAADVAKGTFFNYFETKESILGDIATWRIELLGQRVVTDAQVPASAVARIRLLLKAMVAELPLWRELTAHLLTTRISAPIGHESVHRLDSILHQLVREAQAQGEIRDDLDVRLVTRLLMTCSVFSLVRLHPLGKNRPEVRDTPNPLSLETEILESTDALLNGLGGPRWRNP